MMSSLTTKLALKKLGLPSDTFNFGASSSTKTTTAPRSTNDGTNPGLDEVSNAKQTTWPAWMQAKNLPLTVQPWLNPAPASAPIAELPKTGQPAPLDPEGRLVFGDGKRVLIVFLRCVGCAFAQRTFLALRTLANRYAGVLRCVAVSHASDAATAKWLDMLGGAWNVQVVVDPSRALYALWGLGTGSAWYVLNPATQVASWKVDGWLGQKVAAAVRRSEGYERRAQEIQARRRRGDGGGQEGGAPGAEGAMGNKWQEAGAWAVDQRGSVVWGGKAKSADDVMDLDAGIRALGF